MEKDDIRARIAAIRVELSERVAELDELIAQLGDDRGSGGRPRFTIIRGGLGSMAIPVVTIARRPRRPMGVGAATVVAGALAAVLLIPAHATGGGPGDAISYLSIPAVAPPRAARSAPGHILSPPRTSPAPGIPRTAVSARTASAPGALPGRTVPSGPLPSAISPGTPAPTSAPPTTPPRGTPAPATTSAPGCVINLDIAPILHACVDL